MRRKESTNATSPEHSPQIRSANLVRDEGRRGAFDSFGLLLSGVQQPRDRSLVTQCHRRGAAAAVGGVLHAPLLACSVLHPRPLPYSSSWGTARAREPRAPCCRRRCLTLLSPNRREWRARRRPRSPLASGLVPSDEKPGAQDGRCSPSAGGGRKEPERTWLGGGDAELPSTTKTSATGLQRAVAGAQLPPVAPGPWSRPCRFAVSEPANALVGPLERSSTLRRDPRVARVTASLRLTCDMTHTLNCSVVKCTVKVYRRRSQEDAAIRCGGHGYI